MNPTCPFCADLRLPELEEMTFAGGSTKPVFVATCQGCGAQGPHSESADQACLRWNTRKAPKREKMLRAVVTATVGMPPNTSIDDAFITGFDCSLRTIAIATLEQVDEGK